MKKRALHLLLAGMLVLSMNTLVSAEPVRQEFENLGMTIVIPDELQNTRGYFKPEPINAIDSGHHVYMLEFQYFPMPEDELMSLLHDPELTQEKYLELLKSRAAAGVIFVSDQDLETVEATYNAWRYDSDPLLQEDAMEEFAAADGFTFFYAPVVNDGFYAGVGEEYAKECQEIEAVLPGILKEIEVRKPEDLDKDMVGEKIDFTTTDLDGNEVNITDLFAENKITLVNFWGTWCPNCVKEMPDLAVLHEAFRAKGCGIVGVEREKDYDPETIEKVKQALKEYGTTYPNVTMPIEFSEHLTGFPTTYFVDRDGVVLTMPICGPDVERFESTLDALLAGEDPAALDPSDGEPDADISVGYDITVKDENGPVEGAMIQLCSSENCNMDMTGADGLVHFDLPSDSGYDVHVLVVPAGYEEDTSTYHVSAAENTLEITLQRAE